MLLSACATLTDTVLAHMTSNITLSKAACCQLLPPYAATSSAQVHCVHHAVGPRAIIRRPGKLLHPFKGRAQDGLLCTHEPGCHLFPSACAGVLHHLRVLVDAGGIPARRLVHLRCSLGMQMQSSIHCPWHARTSIDMPRWLLPLLTRVQMMQANRTSCFAARSYSLMLPQQGT